MSSTVKRVWPRRLALCVVSAGVLATSFAGTVAAKGPSGKGTGKGGVFASLTQEQRSCIKTKVMRPKGKKPTPQYRRAVYEAAKQCGVTLPDPGSKNPTKQGGGRHNNG
jgi:hypothetical protein